MPAGDGDELWAPATSLPPQPAASAPVPRPAAVPADPVTLAGYDDFVLLARGGGSVVYRAEQLALRRPVAVKVVHLVDPDAVRLFQRELEITVRLGRQHPNIVTVLDTGETGEGLPCLVMELADGGSLDDRLRAMGPLPVHEVVAAGTVIADALSFAHAQGIIHRDVKPQNILVLPTSYVLADFGIARAADSGHTSSLEMFSYRHAAPQVLDGETPTTADDIYSLGSTMFTLLAGHAPFAGETPVEDSGLAYLRRARTETAPRLERADAPGALRDIVARCLAREPSLRFRDAGELRRALAGLAVQPEVVAPPPPPPVVPIKATTPMTAPPAEPLDTRLAISALAHLPAGPVVTDEATGRAPAAPPPPVVEPKRASPWRWIAVAALVVIGAVSLVLSLTGGRTAGRATGPAPVATAPVATAPVATPPVATPPIASATPAPTVSLLPLPAPIIISIKTQGPAIRLHWTDPSHGADTFIVVQDTGGSGTALGQAPLGQTQLTVTPKTGANKCYVVVAVNGQGRAGASAASCQH